MSEPPTWGGATANPETLLRSLPTSVSSVDFPCNVAVTVHEFIDSNQEICDLWYDTIYWYKIYYLTFRFMCLGDLKLRISFRNFRDESEANLGSFNGMFNWINPFSSCGNGIRGDTLRGYRSKEARGQLQKPAEKNCNYSWCPNLQLGEEQQPVQKTLLWPLPTSVTVLSVDFPWIPWFQSRDLWSMIWYYMFI